MEHTRYTRMNSNSSDTTYLPGKSIQGGRCSQGESLPLPLHSRRKKYELRFERLPNSKDAAGLTEYPPVCPAANLLVVVKKLVWSFSVPSRVLWLQIQGLPWKKSFVQPGRHARDRRAVTLSRLSPKNGN